MTFATARGLASYRQVEVQSRTPLELVTMLYDGAIRFLGTARDAMNRHDIPARREALNKTLAIIAELQNTLNMDQGGEVAVELDRLYEYINMRLLDAAMRNDVAPLDEVTRILGILREGWATIAANEKVPVEAGR
ncbi:MAG: flagellar export chaperone FliS [Acidobacteria bacterium]|nr:flagellar export chaperone FliS [Acidobacteriota bacterium]